MWPWSVWKEPVSTTSIELINLRSDFSQHICGECLSCRQKLSNTVRHDMGWVEHETQSGLSVACKSQLQHLDNITTDKTRINVLVSLNNKWHSQWILACGWKII
jgi:hypothetical protein